MGFMKEFKEFAMRGNVMDLAIGVIIGGAFNKIVTALVDAIITPLVGLFLPEGTKFEEWAVGPIKIGMLVQAVFDFVIIAFVLFLLVKMVNRFRKQTVAEAPAPTKSELLLAEIRDALKK